MTRTQSPLIKWAANIKSLEEIQRTHPNERLPDSTQFALDFVTYTRQLEQELSTLRKVQYQ